MGNVEPVKRLSAFVEAIALLPSFACAARHCRELVTLAGKNSLFEGLRLFRSLLGVRSRRLGYLGWGSETPALGGGLLPEELNLLCRAELSLRYH